MLNYFFASILSGVVFGFLDGVINANSYAQKLFEVYKPIAKTSINVPLGLVIDLAYGFVMAGLFLLFHKSLPGQTNIVKGLSFGLFIWFFRVVMYTSSQFMMFEVPAKTLLYTLGAGLLEMLAIGFLIGLTLKV